MNFRQNKTTYFPHLSGQSNTTEKKKILKIFKQKPAQMDSKTL